MWYIWGKNRWGLRDLGVDCAKGGNIRCGCNVFNVLALLIFFAWFGRPFISRGSRTEEISRSNYRCVLNVVCSIENQSIHHDCVEIICIVWLTIIKICNKSQCLTFIHGVLLLRASFTLIWECGRALPACGAVLFWGAVLQLSTSMPPIVCHWTGYWAICADVRFNVCSCLHVRYSVLDRAQWNVRRVSLVSFLAFACDAFQSY